jgi:LDH2 family malate/lactate/ureidoglycolate dehydrogenase
MSDDVRISLREVHALVTEILVANGFSAAHVSAIADTVTAAERDECRHHGLFRVPFYVNGVRTGQASPDAEPVVTQLAPAVVRVDAKYGFSPLAVERGLGPVAELARKQGIAALAINNALNVAALWPEVEWLASRGLVALAFVAAAPYVAPAGGITPLFGTNPMAFAWPRGDNPPLAFDQASSACARGEMQLRLRDGRLLPENAAIDSEGNPTRDPAAALTGAQLPFGGAKGSNIALMIELVTGPLLGDLLSYEAGERDTAHTGAPCGGELIIALDPLKLSATGDLASQIAHGERLFAKILEQDGTRLPSDRRYSARQRTVTDGVTVARPLFKTLEALRGGATPQIHDYEGDHALR